MGNTSCVLKETRTVHQSPAFGFTPIFWVWSVLLILLVFCVEFFKKFVFALFVFVQSLDCHFLITPSVFSKNVFLTLFRDTLWNVSSEMNTSMPSVKLQLLIIEAN